MADGKIEIEIELDDSNVKKQAQTAGKQAGRSFKAGFEGSSKGSTDKAEEEIKSAGKSAGTSGKSAGKKFKAGFESAVKGIKAPDVDVSKLASAGKSAGTAFAASFASAAAAGVAAGIGAIGVANEYQEDMGKLTVSAQVNNVGIEEANASYREMVGILGEVDQSVEAVNHLFTLTQGNTEQLSDWTTIASGVYASFGDSLPLEGLTEAANESARVSQVVGPLADALNWASLSAEEWGNALSGSVEAQNAFNAAVADGMTVEDAFTEALAACGDETERAQILTDALTAAYGEAGQAYQDVNAPLIEYRKSLSDLKGTVSDLGIALMPLASSIISGISSALGSATEQAKTFSQDFVSAISSGDYEGAGQIISNLLISMVNGLSESLPQMMEIGGQIVSGIIQGITENGPAEIGGVLGSLFASLQSAMSAIMPVIQEVVIPAFQALATNLSQFLETVRPITDFLATALATAFGLVAAAIAVVIGVVTQIIQFFQNLGTEFNNAVTAASSFASGVVGFISGLPGQIAGFLNQVISDLGAWAADMWNKAVEAGQNFLDGVSEKFGEAVDWFTELPDKIINAIGDVGNLLWNTGKSIIDGLWSGLKSAWDSVTGWFAGITASIPSLKGPIEVDRKLLVDNGEEIIGGLLDGMEKRWVDVEAFLGGKTGSIPVSFASGSIGAQITSSFASAPVFSSSSTTTDNSRSFVQYNTFNQKVKSPAEIARELRLQSTYGLAGARG